jgi:hypothetical protein
VKSQVSGVRTETGLLAIDLKRFPSGKEVASDPSRAQGKRVASDEFLPLASWGGVGLHC